MEVLFLKEEVFFKEYSYNFIKLEVEVVFQLFVVVYVYKLIEEKVIKLVSVI